MKQINWAKILFMGFILAVIVSGLLFYRFIFGYMFVSLVFTYIFNPVVNFMEKYWVRRTIAILLLYFILFGSVFLGGLFIYPVFIDELQSISSTFTKVFLSHKTLHMDIPQLHQLNTLVKEISHRFPFLDMDKIKGNVMDYVQSIILSVPDKVMIYLENLINFLSYLVTVPFISFFLLKDQYSLKKLFFAVIPNRYFELSVILIEKIDETIGTYIRALMVEIIIVSIMSSAVLASLGVKYAVVIGITSGIINAIPYFGPICGVLLACLSVWFTGKPIILMLYVIIGMWLVQLIDNNIIYPVVIGKSTEMHPLIIMITVIAGGFAFGLLGMLLSVPAVFLLRGLIQVLYKNLKEFQII